MNKPTWKYVTVKPFDVGRELANPDYVRFLEDATKEQLALIKERDHIHQQLKDSISLVKEIWTAINNAPATKISCGILEKLNAVIAKLESL